MLNHDGSGLMALNKEMLISNPDGVNVYPPPSESGTYSINQVENGVTRVGLGIPGKSSSAPLLNTLTDVPVRHNTYCLMMSFSPII